MDPDPRASPSRRDRNRRRRRDRLDPLRSERAQGHERGVYPQADQRREPRNVDRCAGPALAVDPTAMPAAGELRIESAQAARADPHGSGTPQARSRDPAPARRGGVPAPAAGREASRRLCDRSLRPGRRGRAGGWQRRPLSDNLPPIECEPCGAAGMPRAGARGDPPREAASHGQFRIVAPSPGRLDCRVPRSRGTYAHPSDRRA